MLEFKFIFGETGCKVAEISRNKVFCDELGYSEIGDELDNDSYHFIGYDKACQIGSCRLTKVDEEYYRVSWLCVIPEYRRQYVGDLIMRAIQDKVLSVGGKYIVLETPVSVKGFFAFEDYEEIGESFTVDGTEYIKMKKDVTIIRPCRGCKK